MIQRERVAENVYSFQSEVYAQVTAGAVVGPNWAVVIDTLALPEEALEMRDFIEQELQVPVRYVIDTHYHYDDLQVRQINGPFTIVGNAGKSSVHGVELEISARPMQGLDLFANYSYTDGSYDSLVLEGEDYSGNTLTLTPKNAFTAGASYAFSTRNGGEVSLRGDYLYKSRAFLDVSNDPSMTAKYDGLVNASISYVFPNGKWDVSVFGQNITDVRTKTTAQNYSVFFLSLDQLLAGQQVIATSYNLPATYGVTVRWKL